MLEWTKFAYFIESSVNENKYLINLKHNLKQTIYHAIFSFPKGVKKFVVMKLQHKKLVNMQYFIFQNCKVVKNLLSWNYNTRNWLACNIFFSKIVKFVVMKLQYEGLVNMQYFLFQIWKRVFVKFLLGNSSMRNWLKVIENSSVGTAWEIAKRY